MNFVSNLRQYVPPTPERKWCRSCPGSANLAAIELCKREWEKQINLLTLRYQENLSSTQTVFAPSQKFIA
jgi:hypothetical protein